MAHTKILNLLSTTKRSLDEAQSRPGSLLAAREACENTLKTLDKLNKTQQRLEDKLQILDVALKLLYKYKTREITKNIKLYGETNTFW